MPRIRQLIAMAFALIPLVLVFAPSAARAEKRVALVVGNAGYQVGALATPANDAGLIAQTLQAAGFDVVGARDLDQDSLRRALRDFVEKATAAGPDTVLRAGVRCAASRRFERTDGSDPRAADSRSRHAGSLRRGVGARHAGRLFGIPHRLSWQPAFAMATFCPWHVNTRRKSGDAAARKARCAGRRRCEPGTSCGAQGCSTATKGLPAGEGHGRRERSACV